MQAGQYVLVEVTPRRPGYLIPYDTQHQQAVGPQHRRDDIHSENSIRKNIFAKNIQYKCAQKSVCWDFVTPHAKRNESISPFQLLQIFHKHICDSMIRQRNEGTLQVTLPSTSYVVAGGYKQNL
jgi:hypothetical protein